MNDRPRPRFDTHPPPRSPWGGRITLLLGGILLLGAGWLWGEAMTNRVGTPGSYLEPLEPDPPGTIVIEVRAVLEFPTETPKPTKAVAVPRSTPTPVRDYCGDTARYPGEVCRVPPPPAPTPTPLPSCGSADVEPNQFCQWPGPIPAPTNQPPREEDL